MNPDQIRRLVTFVVGLGAAFAFARQCRKPRWGLGRFVLTSMNARHASLTSWGLHHLRIEPKSRVLDVGCGGGQTIATLSQIATGGQISGVDYSAESVSASKRHNAGRIAEGRVDVQQASVSNLPFAVSTFDIVTAIETHYYWPNLRADLQEILRVLKPGGALMILAETYKGRSFDWVFRPVMTGLLGATYLSVDEHRALLTNAGFADVQVTVDSSKGWICAVGHRPMSA
jgi:ubiquinone/menaquinone biosynthesis C-methylase UbiE